MASPQDQAIRRSDSEEGPPDGLDLLREGLKLVAQKLNSMQNRCAEYEKTIIFQANEIRNLHQSLSENDSTICHQCKKTIDRRQSRHLEPLSQGLLSSESPSATPGHVSMPGGISSLPALPSSANNTDVTLSSSQHFSQPTPSHLNDFAVSSREVQDRTIVFFNNKVKKELDVKLVHTFEHKGYVRSVRFNPKGGYLAATRGQITRVYDMATWEPVCDLMDRSIKNIEIWCVVFSPDGRYLATGSNDKKIRVWEVSKRHVRNMFIGHQQDVLSLNFSPNGRLLASASFDGTIRIWNMRGWTPKVLSDIGTGRDAGIRSVVFSLDGLYVIAGGVNGTITTWSMRTMQIVKRLKGHRGNIYSLALTPDGKGLLSGSGDETPKYWDVGTLGVPLCSQEIGGNKERDDHSVHEDLTVLESVKDIDKEVQPLLAFTGHKTKINSVSVTPNGRWVVSGSDDRSVRIWDSQNAKMQCTVSHGTFVSACFSPVGKYLATADWGGQVRIWTYGELS